VRFPRLSPGDRLTADLVNRMLDAIERVENMSADASSGIELVRSAGNISLRLNSNALQQDSPPVQVARVLGADTVLQWAITDSQTSLQVASFYGFPAAGSYYVLVDSEVMEVTGGAGTTRWTVSRGQLGTSPDSHVCGAVAYQTTYLTATLSSEGTCLTVADGSLFPPTATQTPYYLLVGSEVMAVTGGAGTTMLTVTRGQYDSSPESHPADTPVLLWAPGTGYSLEGAKQAVLTSQDPESGDWTDAGVIFLKPINNRDPYLTPLLSQERYLALPDGKNQIPYFQAQAKVPAASLVVAEVAVTSTTTAGGYYPGVILNWVGGTGVPGFAAPGSGSTACLIQGPNNESLTVRNYNANYLGIDPPTQKPVFEVEPGAACTDTGGNSLTVVTDVTCDAEGLHVTTGTFTAACSICGSPHGITFTQTE
jgi:hypothetical protein